MSELKEEVGKRLKECRADMRLSQRDVARLLGVAQPVYQRFEKGVFECGYEYLSRLCDIFDVSADYLLGRKEY
jgi:transcriptional regulator with XRE-family HTH domain